MEYDAVNVYDLASCEIRQRRESGYDVAGAEQALERIDPEDRAALLAFLDGLAARPRLPGWRYDEPDGLEAILRSLPPAPPARPPPAADLDDRILGGWLGRVAGCILGKPVEVGDVWTTARLREYLEQAGAYPLRDYIPVIPGSEHHLHWTWPWTTRGNVDGAFRDDDIDYAILGLHLLEKHGTALTTHDVADAWLELLPFRQTYTAERVAYRNLVDGVPLDRVGRYRNPYREWIGAQIRGDVFGWTHPGDPRGAAVAAYADARLSHVGNGRYGEMWAAALVAAAFVADSPNDALTLALAQVPPRSRLAEAVDSVMELHAGGATWDDAVVHIAAEYGHYLWVHTIPNAAVVTAGLLWGEGDVAATLGSTVQAGWDTDSNGATAGSVIGVMVGGTAIPGRFVDPLKDTVRSALFGFDNASIADLARRTVALARAGR